MFRGSSPPYLKYSCIWLPAGGSRGVKAEARGTTTTSASVSAGLFPITLVHSPYSSIHFHLAEFLKVHLKQTRQEMYSGKSIAPSISGDVDGDLGLLRGCTEEHAAPVQAGGHASEGAFVNDSLLFKESFG